MNWLALLSPRIELEPGKYEVIDSDKNSWSRNAASQNKGFAKVWLKAGWSANGGADGGAQEDREHDTKGKNKVNPTDDVAPIVTPISPIKLQPTARDPR